MGLFFFLTFTGFLRERAQAGEGQRERETQNPKQAPGSELSAQSWTRGSNSRTARDRDLSWSQKLSPLKTAPLYILSENKKKKPDERTHLSLQPAFPCCVVKANRLFTLELERRESTWGTQVPSGLQPLPGTPVVSARSGVHPALVWPSRGRPSVGATSECYLVGEMGAPEALGPDGCRPGRELDASDPWASDRLPAVPTAQTRKSRLRAVGTLPDT